MTSSRGAPSSDAACFFAGLDLICFAGSFFALARNFLGGGGMKES
jgi:hypothetical protein